MEPQIISYLEMCSREGVNLQQGMNFRLGGHYSVILMSIRANAPYQDNFTDDGTTLIYEGHDVPRNNPSINPKLVDQPERTSAGTLTQNGKFHKVAQEVKASLRSPELVRVYEKIRSGIWADNGLFELVDSWLEYNGIRKVFKFKLVAIEDDEVIPNNSNYLPQPSQRRRLIPTEV